MQQGEGWREGVVSVLLSRREPGTEAREGESGKEGVLEMGRREGRSGG